MPPTAHRSSTIGTAGHRRPASLIFVVVLVVVVALGIVSHLSRHQESPAAAAKAGQIGCANVEQAFANHSTGILVTVSATVSRVLADSHGSSTHQRFILRCSSGQTVLIDNNVDVGSRAPVTVDGRVVARGQYIWNDLGGLIHDTHHSTGGSPGGWLLVGGNVYQ